jgi:small subunit ribosomal protein S6
MFLPGDWFNLLKNIMATENSLQSYELMLILTPVLSDEEYKSTQKKYADLIKENGGTIVHQDAWGLRSLSYPIAKKTTGLYYVLEYKAPTETNAKLEIQMNRDEAIMRHMVTRIDKYAEAYNLRKRNKNATVENAS